MKKQLIILILLCLPILLFAQKEEEWVSAYDLQMQWQADSIAHIDTLQHDIQPTTVDFRPDPMHAVWMGAIIPGYGQIYNRAYWKLPIVYGAFMGCAYAITWNNRIYQDYRHGYASIVLGTDDYYLELLPEGYTIEMVGGVSNFTKTLKSKRDSYRRFRDLSIVGTVLVYALSLVDAYVDAQLWDFDISTDLSLNLSPTIYNDPYFPQHSVDLNVAIKF